MRALELGNVVWRKSTYSGQGGDCVEIAALPAGFHAVRDSKCPCGFALVFRADAWGAFVREVKDVGPAR
ncbi:DUF397 domain-containing protein [Streptomyces sp. O3]